MAGASYGAHCGLPVTCLGLIRQGAYIASPIDLVVMGLKIDMEVIVYLQIIFGPDAVKFNHINKTYTPPISEQVQAEIDNFLTRRDDCDFYNDPSSCRSS